MRGQAAVVLLALLLAACLHPSAAGPKKAKKPPPKPKPPAVPPPGGDPATAWSCVVGLDFPVRLNSNMDVECWSMNGATCSGKTYCDDMLGELWPQVRRGRVLSVQATPMHRRRLQGTRFPIVLPDFPIIVGPIDPGSGNAPAPPSPPSPPSPSPAVPLGCGAMMKAFMGKTGYEDVNGWCWKAWYSLMREGGVSPWVCPPPDVAGNITSPVRFVLVHTPQGGLIDMQCYSTDGKSCAKGPCNKAKLDKASIDDLTLARPVHCICYPGGPNTEYCRKGGATRLRREIVSRRRLMGDMGGAGADGDDDDNVSGDDAVGPDSLAMPADKRGGGSVGSSVGGVSHTAGVRDIGDLIGDIGDLIGVIGPGPADSPTQEPELVAVYPKWCQALRGSRQFAEFMAEHFEMWAVLSGVVREA